MIYKEEIERMHVLDPVLYIQWASNGYIKRGISTTSKNRCRSILWGYGDSCYSILRISLHRDRLTRGIITTSDEMDLHGAMKKLKFLQQTAGEFFRCDPTEKNQKKLIKFVTAYALKMRFSIRQS
jgi:hypothetical protein